MAAGPAGPPRISGSPARAPAGELIEISGDNLGTIGRPGDSTVIFFAGTSREPLRVAPELSGPRLLRVRVPRGALRGPVGVQTARGKATAPADFAPEYLLHVPVDLFAPGGALGALEIEACRVILADGPNGSLLRVSPAMARLGFRDISFTVAPFTREVAFGPLATTMRLRIPGRDPADPTTTIQSTRVTMRVVGAGVELSVLFEGQGSEMIGEYYAGTSPSGAAEWVQALDVEADGLTITVSFPIVAQGNVLGLGSPKVTADFSFAVAARGLAAVALDGSFAKELVKSALEHAVAGVLDLKTYRDPLATAITTWLREDTFRELPLREFRLTPAADGGLDVLAVMTGDP